METAVRQISNPNGSIELFDLYNNDGSFNYQPCLCFVNAEFDGCWDNSEWVLKFFRGLKKNKKEEKQELKTFCKDSKLDYKETKKQLLRIYKTSQYLNFWKV